MANKSIQNEREGFWSALVAKQEQSGKSVRAFCRESGAKEHSFYMWRQKLRRQAPVRFALVERTGSGMPESTIEVVFANGDKLKIGRGADAATLRTVLAVLRESA